MNSHITQSGLSAGERRLVLGLILIITLLSYFTRMSISVALPSITKDFGWSELEQGRLGGILMGIFLLSYGFSNIYFSPGIDRFGAKLTLSFSALVTALSLVLAGLFGHIYLVFLLTRLLLGLAQGVVFPSASKVIAGHFPLSMRSRANSIFISGAPIGSLITPLIITPIIIASTWENALFTSAGISVLCLIPVFLLFALLHRASAPAPAAEEERPLKGNDAASGEAGSLRPSFSLLKEQQFRVILISFTLMMAVWWGFTMWLPTYLIEAKGFLLNQMKYGAAIIYIGAAAGLYTGSWISDATGHRKRIIAVSLISTFVFFFIITMIPIESKIVGLVLIFITVFVLELAPPIFFTILQGKIEESEIGAASGLMNGIGNTGSIIGPLSVGFVVSLTGSYEVGLFVLGSLALIAGINLLFRYREVRQN